MKGEHRKFIPYHAGRGTTRPQEIRDKIARAKTGVRRPDMTGENNHFWTGGVKTRGDGYLASWVGSDHPMASADGYVLEHRLVVSESIGRPLTSEEVVHHVNGVRDDNRIENLRLLSSASEHTALHNPKGKRHTQETRKRMSEARHRWWADRRVTLTS